jgi:cholesterol transport system auxiliary component
MKSAVVISMAFLLSACISFGAKPPERLLRLTAAQTIAPGTAQSVAAGEAITVLTPTVPSELANNRVPVRSGNGVAYVKDAQWVDQPNRLFQSLLSEIIAARTGRPVLSGRQFSFDPGARITGELQAFGVDESGGTALVIFDAAVARGTTIQTRRFEARVPVGVIEAEPVGAALNQAANQVAAEVADWLK